MWENIIIKEDKMLSDSEKDLLERYDVLEKLRELNMIMQRIGGDTISKIFRSYGKSVDGDEFIEVNLNLAKAINRLE